MKTFNAITIALAALVAVGMSSCQTSKGAGIVPPQASGIETEARGFSPMAKTDHDTIDLALTLGSPEFVKAWKVDLSIEGSIKKTFSGAGSSAPSILTWDGKTDAGTLAPEGTYVATLDVYYASKYSSFTARSDAFILDMAPPSGKLIIEPWEPTLNDQGFEAPVIITIDAGSNTSTIESWYLEIIEPNGKTVYGYSGTWPQGPISWDGYTYGGILVSPATVYQAIVLLRDEYGNMGEIRSAIRVKDGPAAVEIPKAEKIPSIAATVSIAPRARGFSPNGDSSMDTIAFDVRYGQHKEAKSWKAEIRQNGKSVRDYRGDASTLPSALVWDGNRTDGSAAAEGSYTAFISVDYGATVKAATATSAPIELALGSPRGSVSLSEPLFSPIESSPTITIAITASSEKARMESWSMKIYDPNGSLFKSFDGAWPITQAVWDGMGLRGYMVESAEDYAVSVKVRDEFGNSSYITSTIPVDILVEKTAEGYRILSSRIFFKAYAADYSTVAAEYASQNVLRLDRIAKKLSKFPGYSIRIVGHAVMINWDDKTKGEIEQRDVLVPLSLARADAIAMAMVLRGFDRDLLIVEGVGADDQLVPDSDLVERWRNRRVAFYLRKP